MTGFANTMTFETRVKICGLTRAEDAVQAAAAGADAVGIIFYPASARYVDDLGRAREIAEAVGPFVAVTALFVNADQGQIERVLQQVPVNLLQFHGSESAAFCERFGRPYMKAIRMAPALDVDAAIAPYAASASAVLLDAYSPGQAGGTGETFDWARVPKDCPVPLVLAGGLTPENVAAAVAAVRPYGVDVSGGVEAVSDGQQIHGIKDRDKIAAFVRRAKFGDEQ